MIKAPSWLNNTSKSYVLLNPRIPEPQRRFLEEGLQHQSLFPSHIWISTSGTTGTPKWVVLSKEAILASAEAVNQHLESNRSDVWLQALPLFHVGGLGIQARSSLSNASCIDCAFPNEKWDPDFFVNALNQHRATLTALVPTQIFDLVANAQMAPPSLRAVIVGGGALSELLYDKAQHLGWKLLPSYGLTECSSQVATAPLGSTNLPLLEPLSHVKIDLDPAGYLKIQSPALLTAYVQYDKEQGWSVVDPKIDGWFTTEDLPILENGRIKAIARNTGFVKIGGESVDLQKLDKVLERIVLNGKFSFDAALTIVPDERLGCQIELSAATQDVTSAEQLARVYGEHVLPFERVRSIKLVNAIPRTALGKLYRTTS